MEITYDINDIDVVARKVVAHLTSKTILINGNMGVGKTTFVKALALALGSKDKVSSPTFSIVNEYELEDGFMYHFDFYRIKNEEEALQFGIEDYLSSNHWLVMEWSEKIPNLIPKNVNSIELNLIKKHSRSLKLNLNINLTENNGIKLHNFG